PPPLPIPTSPWRPRARCGGAPGAPTPGSPAPTRAPPPETGPPCAEAPAPRPAPAKPPRHTPPPPPHPPRPRNQPARRPAGAPALPAAAALWRITGDPGPLLPALAQAWTANTYTRLKVASFWAELGPAASNARPLLTAELGELRRHNKTGSSSTDVPDDEE